MSYGLNDGENRGVIQFPEDGVKATNVPLQKMVFAPSDGLYTAKQEDVDYNGHTSKELDSTGSFQKIRSFVIYTNVPVRIKGIYEDPIHLAAGKHKFQEVPETEEFEVDYGFRYSENDLEPAEAQTFIRVFNTPRIQEPGIEDIGHAVDNEDVSIDSTDWHTVIAQPAIDTDEETLNFENTGSNDVEYRFLTHSAGRTSPVSLDAQGTKIMTLSSGSTKRWVHSGQAELVEVQARQASSGNPSTIDADFTGES